VEGYAFGDPALIDKGDADLRERAQLQVAVLRIPAAPVRLAGQGLVLAGIGREGRLGDQHPALQRLEGMLVDQTGGTRHPPGGGMVAEVGVIKHGDLDGDGGSLGRIGLPPESRVCSLPEFERLSDLTQPPQGLYQAR